MKCEECLPLLDLYSDGELPGRDSDAVAAHLGACATCAGRLQDLRDEQALYLSYECDAAESPEFWDEVLSQIRADNRAGKPRATLTPAPWRRGRLAPMLAALSTPRFSPTLVAALLLVAVGLTAAVTRYFAPREQTPAHSAEVRDVRDDREVRKEGETTPTPPGPPAGTQQPDEKVAAVADRHEGPRSVAAIRKAPRAVEVKHARPAPASAAQEPAPDRLVREAEQKYLAAIRILSRDVAGRRTRMEPEALARFERTLGVIDKSIAETRAAARRHPRDPLAVQYMLTAYAKKVEVLREMAQN